MIGAQSCSMTRIYFLSIQTLLSAVTAATTTVQNGLQNVRGHRPRGASNRGCICDLGSLYYQKWIFEAEAATIYLEEWLSRLVPVILAAVKRPLHLLKYGVEMI